jgi:RNA polymerase-interacting CarD/CdnL/TRCF family regulator
LPEVCFRTVGSGRYPAVVRLAVGDMVVYASHGAGRVAARERRVVLGKRQVVIVLELAGGLSVELPMERAHELLRPLASEADMSRVQKTLGADHAVQGSMAQAPEGLAGEADRWRSHRAG